MAQCAGRSRNTGERCKNPAEPGKKVCRFHGGRTPGGPLNPNWKNGKYSKYLPAQFLEKYGDSLKSSLSMREEIAVLDARLAERLESLETGDSAEYMDKLAGLWNRLTSAQKKEDRDQAAAKIDELIRVGMADTAAWREVSWLIEQRRRLVDTEVKNMSQVHRMVSLEELVSYLGMLVAAVKESAYEHADDVVAKKILQAVNAQYAKLLGAGTSVNDKWPSKAAYVDEDEAPVDGEFVEAESA